jgi:hypothetical protein
MTAHRSFAIACAAALLTTLPALAQPARPPGQIKITNTREVPLEMLEISTMGEPARLVAKLAKPLAPRQSVTLKLTKPAGCSYNLMGRFGDDADVEHEAVDLCKERTLRLTD